MHPASLTGPSRRGQTLEDDLTPDPGEWSTYDRGFRPENRTRTVVPFPGTDLRLKRPPCSFTRAFMMERPSPPLDRDDPWGSAQPSKAPPLDAADPW